MLFEKMIAFHLTLSLILFVAASALEPCVDEPADDVNAIAASYGITITDGCSSSTIQNKIKQGKCNAIQGLYQNCCQSCIDHHYPLPETQLPEDGGFDKPVKLYLQAGQSECVGVASNELLLEHEEETGNYSDLVGEQDGVYIAGYNEAWPLGIPDESRFFISKMELEKEGKSGTFGPEIAIGRRLQDASPLNTDIMIVKYCWGGSNVAFQWDPDSAWNTWNQTADDKTSDYLLAAGAADLTNKKNLFGNLIYTARRTIEALEDANITHEWAGMIWIQGIADKDSTWEEFGEDTQRLFTQVRTELGVDDLPIIDTGAEVVHSLYSGKIYSASTIPNCNVKVVQPGQSVADPSSNCTVTASSICPTFSNNSFWEHYGIDPVLAESPYSENITDSLLNKTFTWYKSYPDNLHSEYDGIIWKGNMLANEFIRTFTNWTLTPEMTLDDPIELFPSKSCGRPEDSQYTPPSDLNICYIDERDDAAISAITCDVETGGTDRRKLAKKGSLRKKL